MPIKQRSPDHIEDAKIDPEWTLLYYLRNKLKLTGTKLGCAEGGCGACTVMISKYNRISNKVVHFSANACLAPICSVHGLAITTVEGIGSTRSKIHPVQERIAKAHGSQCGFCTPGIVMSMYTLLRSLPGKPTVEDLETAFQGNLCRCTGYRPIIEGFRSFTEEWEQQQAVNGMQNGKCPMGDQCCKNQKVNGQNGYQENNTNGYTNGHNDVEDALFNSKDFVPYDPSQEPIFPPELKISNILDNQFLVIQGPRATWYRPTTLTSLLNLKAKFPSAKIVNGNTEIGVEVKFKNCLYPELILPNQIPELSGMKVTEEGIRIGAATTLSSLDTMLRQIVSDLPDYKTKVYQAIISMLHWFAGKQIRNVAVVGGNIMTGSPISDLNPIFMAAKCKLELISSPGGNRIIPFDSGFWTGYRRNVVKPEEVLLAIHIPFTSKNQHFAAYKQSKRREDDIAIVNAAFNLQLDNQSQIVSFVMSFGGMAPTTVMAPKTCAALLNKLWTSETIESVFSLLMEELPLEPGAPGGMVSYRRSLTLSLLFKFYLFVSETLVKNNLTADVVPDRYKSAIKNTEAFSTKSSQYFQVVPDGQAKEDLVGRPIVHKSAFKQATGEAVYCDDIPNWEEQLYLSPVFSSRANARILSIDASTALSIPGVHGILSAKDLPGKANFFGSITKDDMVFADEKVMCVGQVVAAVVADSQLLAQRAAKLVQVEYEDLGPPIITIEDAIRENSYYKPAPLTLRYGDPEAAFSSADHVLEGRMRLSAQEQFYLETHACVVIPKGEDDEYEVVSSTQHPSELQEAIAHTLGIQSNRVVVKVKRIGGGFGGKETRSAIIGLPCALAASKFKKPVRCMLDRDEDMICTGQRHPFLGIYKVAFTSTGKFTAYELTLYNNAGISFDLSNSVMERAMLLCQNAYYIPNASVKGYVCKTNIVSNTAFRGFGAPQAMLIVENMMREVASYLKMDPYEVSRLNLFKNGDETIFHQSLTNCTLERCWQEVVDQSQYHSRFAAVQQFNKNNRWRKRGIAIAPTCFGVAYTSLFLNQSGALVLVYADGSVLVSHGGMEMGQGLHTKMIQVASRVLSIPASLIHISETSTDKVPNTGPTAASLGSDLNGMAIIDACNKILKRLVPYKKSNPEGSWKDWVKKAFFDRVSLAATGFYKIPDIQYDFEKNKGLAFDYFTYGVGCSEVEIDCLTGDHQVLRTDIVMDIGESLNPAIDVGQVEGAFMQGYGLFTIEETVHSPQGALLSRGPGAYKIPGFTDIPIEFNVSLLKGSSNVRAVYSSKAVGEPPLFLASSVFFAIRDAIQAARAEVGLTDFFPLNSPATAARIRMACSDHITEKFPEPELGTYKPWSIQL